jgi:hypothetical protein
LLLLLNCNPRLCHPYLISCIPCKLSTNTLHHTPHTTHYTLPPPLTIHSFCSHSRTQDQHPRTARTHLHIRTSAFPSLLLVLVHPETPLRTRRLDASSCPRPFCARQHCSPITNPPPYESSSHLIIIFRQRSSSVVCCMLHHLTPYLAQQPDLYSSQHQDPPISPFDSSTTSNICPFSIADSR